jgi:hypothetical protein
MRMADADDLVAVDVFNAAQATGERVTTALVRRVVDDLLTHPPQCGCGRCDAAATARRRSEHRLKLAKSGRRHQDNAQPLPTDNVSAPGLIDRTYR